MQHGFINSFHKVQLIQERAAVICHLKKWECYGC